jgi:hypothetical protein
VEQRCDALHPGNQVTSRGAAEVVVDVAGAIELAQRRGSLVTEASESEGGAPAGCGAHRAELRGRTVVGGGVDVVGVRAQVGQPGPVDLHLGPGLGVPVGRRLRRLGVPETAFRNAEPNVGCGDRRGGVPGHHHLMRGIGTELQVQPAHPGRTSLVRPLPQRGGTRRRKGMRFPDQHRTAHGCGTHQQTTAAKRPDLHKVTHGGRRSPPTMSRS